MVGKGGHSHPFLDEPLSRNPPFIGLSGKQNNWITLVANLYIISTLKASYFWKNVDKSGEIQT